MIEVLLGFLKAFVVGGTICTIAQLIINKTKLTTGKILVLFLLCGLFLQVVGLYEYLVEFGGAGATVPISGFGYLLAEGAIKGAKSGLLSAVTGGLISASSGVTSAIFFGYLFALIFKPKSKNN